MIPTTLFAIFAAVIAVNGAVVQRGASSAAPNATSAVPTSGTSLAPSSLQSTFTITPCPSSFLPSSSPIPSSSPSVTISVASSAPPATTTTSTGSGNCNGVQQWQAYFAYTAGNRTIYNNVLYTATQWTYDNAPPTHLDQWKDNGACNPPINNQANCTGVPAWSNTVAYTTGEKVTYNGSLWSAVQWTEASVPGGQSGTWQDLGVCA